MTHLKHAIVMALFIGAFSAEAISQVPQNTPKILTLNEAVMLSINVNKQLKVDNAKINGALARVKEAEDKRLPDLNVSGSYLLLNNPNFSMKAGDGGGSGSGGGTPNASPFRVNQALLGMVNASVPIYAGGQIKYGIQSAQYLAEAVRLDAQTNRQAVIQNTVLAYANLYKAAETVKVVEESLAEENRRVKDFTNLEKNGLLARNDLMKASLQASNVELALLEAKSNHQVANTNMCIMLGLPESTALTVDAEAFKLFTDNRTLLQWEETALQKRTEFAANQNRLKATDAQMKAIHGSMLPSISGSGGYVSADVQNILSVTNAVNLGIGVKYSVSGLWKTKAKMDEARAGKEELLAYNELLDDQVRMQVSKAYEDYLLSVRKIEVYNKAIEQAEENYRITNNKYKNGLATLTDLLDADLGQIRARLNKANAFADVSVAYAKLLQSAGILDQQIQK